MNDNGPSNASARTRNGLASPGALRRSAATVTGDHGAATAKDDQGAATATGSQGAATVTGYRGAATASGDQGAATATGDHGAVTATGAWGAATAMHLASFEQKYHRRGSVISAVPLVWGIAALGGLKTPRVEGANGDLDTNYEGKVQRALDALLSEGDDFAAVHVEAPDEMAHAGSLEKKLAAIQFVN